MPLSEKNQYYQIHDRHSQENISSERTLWASEFDQIVILNCYRKPLPIVHAENFTCICKEKKSSYLMMKTQCSKADTHLLSEPSHRFNINKTILTEKFKRQHNITK